MTRVGGFPGVPYKAKEDEKLPVADVLPAPIVHVEPAKEESRLEALKELTEISEEMGLYDEEVEAPKVDVDETEVRQSKKKKKFNREEQ